MGAKKLNEEQKKECIRLADLMVEMLDEGFMENVDPAFADSEEDDSMDILVAMKEESFRVLKEKLIDYISEGELV